MRLPGLSAKLPDTPWATSVSARLELKRKADVHQSGSRGHDPYRPATAIDCSGEVSVVISRPPKPAIPVTHLARRRALRSGALVIWAAALTVQCLIGGIPIDRPQQTLWILAGITAATIGSSRRRLLRMLIDWVPWVGLLVVYDLSRGVADTLGRPIHVTQPLAVDKELGGGTVPTVWLQDHLYDPTHLHWWDVAASVVYVSHFFTAWVIVAVLYVRSRERWAAFASRILLLSFAGLATYVLYPAAPPWFAGREGLTPHIHRFSGQGFRAFGLDAAEPLITKGQAAANSFAAVPSLHAAFAFLICLFFWPGASTWRRCLLAAYPLAMGFSLVYTGEHYVIDVMLGALYASGTVWVAGFAGRRFQRRGERIASELR